MNKIIRFLFLLMMLAGLAKTVHAGGTVTVNGIPLEYVEYGKVSGLKATPFSQYPFETTKVFNESAQTGTTSGLIEVSDYTLKTIGIRTTSNVGEGTLTVNVNFFVGTTSYSSGSVTINVYGTATYILPLTEYCTYLNIGGNTDTGTITADIDLLAVRED